jgi:hypothetical protein
MQIVPFTRAERDSALRKLMTVSKVFDPFNFIQAIGVRGFHAMLTPCELKDQIDHSFGEAAWCCGLYAAPSQLAWTNSGQTVDVL